DVDDLVRAVTAAIEEEDDADPYDDEDDEDQDEPPAPSSSPAAPPPGPAGTPAPAAPRGPGEPVAVVPVGTTPQVSHERVPMVLRYPAADHAAASRRVQASREVFPQDASAAVVLRALRPLVAVLDSRHAHDGAVTLPALLRAAGAEQDARRA